MGLQYDHLKVEEEEGVMESKAMSAKVMDFPLLVRSLKCLIQENWMS
jgi:hypothetical protein